MKLKVNKDTCTIVENEIWNVGDYNVHTVEVELSDDFNGLVNKVRYFVGEYCYDMLITDNVAQVPIEATQKERGIEIGVYGFDADTEMLVQSTTPVQKYITKGTYIGEPENVEPLTPTDKEQIEMAIQTNTNNIEANANAISNLQDSKQDILVSGENIKTINNQSILGEGNIDIQGGSGTGNYNDLNNKPQINNVILQGNKTLSQLGIQPAGSYATTQELNTEISNRQNTDSNLQEQIDDKADKSEIPDLTDYLQESDVINNVTSTDTDMPLSANMGKELNDRIESLSARGRFLSNWNMATGLPTTDPITSGVYQYRTGDYYIVSNVGTTNYKPNGSSYTIGVPSSTVETNTVLVGDTYRYDGTTWILEVNTERTTTFANIAGQPTDNTNLASALNSKVDLTSDQTIGGNKTFNEKIIANNIGTAYSTEIFNIKAGTSTLLSVGSGTSIIRSNLVSNPSYNLGSSSYKWNNLYLSGNLSDGTNSVAVADIANKNNFVTLTQAEYDALETKDPNTYYFIEEE